MIDELDDEIADPIPSPKDTPEKRGWSITSGPRSKSLEWDLLGSSFSGSMMPLPLSTLGLLVGGGDSLLKSPLVLVWKSKRVGERVCERLSSYEARTDPGKLMRLLSVVFRSN